MPGIEFWLMGGVILAYVVDSALLLFANEGALTRTASGRWRARLGAAAFTLGGRGLYLPPLGAPHQPLFRLVWTGKERVEQEKVNADEQPQAESAPAETQARMAEAVDVFARWESVADAFYPLSLPLLLIALGLYLYLPLALFSRLGHFAFGFALALAYGGALHGILWVYWHRERFGLTRPRWAALALECLLCPPCALNLVRKVSVRLPATLLPTTELVQTASLLLEQSELERFHRELVPVLEETLEADADASKEAGLRHLRASLVAKEGM